MNAAIKDHPFVVSLIAAKGGLPCDLPAAVANVWGGDEVSWLAPHEAAEFAIPAMPADQWDMWEKLQNQSVDMAIQPSAGRRKKMLLADMDSTMIEQECIDELADEAGVGDFVKDITARAMNGELDFESALRERVGLLKGLPTSVIEDVLRTRITYMPGGAQLLATMKANGAYCALVSGGFTAFTQSVAQHLGFDVNRANLLHTENGVLSGTVAEPILGRDAKVAALHEFSAAQGITPADVIAVGDGANDLGMLGLAGSGVALHAKPTVAAQCELRINFGDLTALLYLQGYAKADFVGA